MDFMIDLPILKYLKDKLIVIIVNKLIKIVHYKLVQTIIDVIEHVKVIIYTIVRHYDFLVSIINNRHLLFMLKFWSSL